MKKRAGSGWHESGKRVRLGHDGRATHHHGGGTCFQGEDSCSRRRLWISGRSAELRSAHGQRANPSMSEPLPITGATGIENSAHPMHGLMRSFTTQSSRHPAITRNAGSFGFATDQFPSCRTSSADALWSIRTIIISSSVWGAPQKTSCSPRVQYACTPRRARSRRPSSRLMSFSNPPTRRHHRSST